MYMNQPRTLVGPGRLVSGMQQKEDVIHASQASRQSSIAVTIGFLSSVREASNAEHAHLTRREACDDASTDGGVKDAFRFRLFRI